MNDAKVYQAVDSSGTTDLTETPSPGEAVLSDVREEGSKTDEREIACDYDMDHHESDVLWPEQNEQLDAEVTHRPRRPCNFGEDGDEYEMQDDFHEVQRNDEEEIAWQHHLDRCTEDQLMIDIARAAIEEARARAKANEIEVLEVITVKKKGDGQASSWIEGAKPGMVFNNGSQGVGYYKDEKVITI